MPANDLKSLYAELQRAFNAGQSGLKKCGQLLAQLKIGLIEAGLLIPVGEPNPEDLVVARAYPPVHPIRANDL